MYKLFPVLMYEFDNYLNINDSNIINEDLELDDEQTKIILNVKKQGALFLELTSDYDQSIINNKYRYEYLIVKENNRRDIELARIQNEKINKDIELAKIKYDNIDVLWNTSSNLLFIKYLLHRDMDVIDVLFN